MNSVSNGWDLNFVVVCFFCLVLVMTVNFSDVDSVNLALESLASRHLNHEDG